jgi:hypothetical protein
VKNKIGGVKFGVLAVLVIDGDSFVEELLELLKL